MNRLSLLTAAAGVDAQPYHAAAEGVEDVAVELALPDGMSG